MSMYEVLNTFAWEEQLFFTLLLPSNGQAGPLIPCAQQQWPPSAEANPTNP